MLNSCNFVSIDLELTGLEENSAVTEIALIHYKDAKEESRFAISVIAERAVKHISALHLTKKKTHDLYLGYSPLAAAKATVDYLCEKVLPASDNVPLRWLGHNTHFDVQKLSLFLQENNFIGLSDIFDYHILDTASMASLLNASSCLQLDKLSLSHVASRLGIKVDAEKLHSALYDAELAAKCFFKMTELLQGLSSGQSN